MRRAGLDEPKCDVFFLAVKSRGVFDRRQRSRSPLSLHLCAFSSPWGTNAEISRSV